MNPKRTTRSVRIESLEARSMFAADAMAWMPLPVFSEDSQSAWRVDPIRSSRDPARDLDRGRLPLHADDGGNETMRWIDGSESRGIPSRAHSDAVWMSVSPVKVDFYVVTLPMLRISDMRLDGARADAWIISVWNPASTGNSVAKPRSDDLGAFHDSLSANLDSFMSNTSLDRNRTPISAIESRDRLAKPILEERTTSSMIQGVSTLAGAWLSSGTLPSALANSAWNAWVQSDVSLLAKLDGRPMQWSDVARRTFGSVDIADDSRSESFLDPISREDVWNAAARETSVDRAFSNWEVPASGRSVINRSRSPRWEFGRASLPSSSQAIQADGQRMLLMRTPRVMMDAQSDGQDAKPIQLLSSLGMLPPIARTLSHEGGFNIEAPESLRTPVASWSDGMGVLPTTATNDRATRANDADKTSTPTQRWLVATATTAIVSAWVALQSRRAASVASQTKGEASVDPKPIVRNLRSE